MPWENGHYSVSHPREPWSPDTPPVLVHAPLSVLNGPKKTPARKAYVAAKREFDIGAAFEVVERTVRQDTLDSIIAHVVSLGINCRIIMPHPAFDDDDGAGHAVADRPRNAIPFAYANYLSKLISRPVDEEIVQIARVGRTKLAKWPRFLCQPSFGGAVRVDEPYIIVDDAVTTAGTFAALRSYIVRNGGSVIFTTALANSTGVNCQLAIGPEIHKVLLEAFGNGFEPFWFNTIGHQVGCLTEAEAQFLRENADVWKSEGCVVGDELLQRLRDRIDEAATKNR